MNRVLIIRHHRVQREFYSFVLKWVGERYPVLLPCFEVRETDNLPTDLSPYGAAVFWLQDPVDVWTANDYPKCVRFGQRCHEHNIPVINPVDRYHNTERTRAAEIIGCTGLHVPRIARIRDVAEWRQTLLGLTPPLFIREDRCHGGPIYSADTPDAARRLEVEFLDRPVAVEIVDVRAPGGLYRKYRYIAAGHRGVSHHLIIANKWITRGDDRIFTDATRAEELDFLSRQDPHHARFQRAALALGLDFVAFDYGLLPDGQPVIWEANPFPLIKYGQSTSRYRNHAIDRTIATMVALYLDKAGIELPPALNAAASY